MDLIRIYCDEFDIRTKNLIHHFLRYAGFYVEEKTADADEKSDSEISSTADIYVVGKLYVERHKGTLKLDWDEGTILILMDGMELKGREDELEYIEGTGLTEKDMLCQLAVSLAVVIERRGLSGNRHLAGSTENFAGMLKKLAEVYMEYDIMPLCFYAKCFYAKELLWKRARDGYQKFINGLQSNANPGCASDLNLYAVSYAMYEMDVICKRNGYVFLYPVEKLRSDAQYLCEKYPENEQIHLFYADILMELEDNWMMAANEYIDEHVTHCAYALYRHGRIRRKYAKDSENALEVLRAAIFYKRDYFSAWYQIGLCYEMQYDCRRAILAYEKVGRIVKERYERHMLSPIELEYFYKAVVKLEDLHRSIQNDREAREYEKERNKLKKSEPEQIKYHVEIWPDMPEDLSGNIIAWSQDMLKLESICGV